MAESFASSSTWTGPIRPPTAPAPKDATVAPVPGPITVAFRTLGCKVNQVESEDIAAGLLGRGVALMAEEDAAVIVVNTCTVTAEADHKARKAIRHALALPQGPVVVVTGCMAAVDGAAIEALGERVVVEADKERVAERVGELLGIGDAPHEHALRAGAGFHTRAMLKVEDGCDNFCTYCIVPYARGVPRSVPLDRVLAEAGALARVGVREFVVTGINVGRYRDPETGTDLAGLLAALGETGVPRLRLSSIEPPDVNARFLEVVPRIAAFCPHLHVPLQSGSDRVLARMGRAYDTAEFEARIARAREAFGHDLAVTTDVLVGFPGETEEDIAATIALCERVGTSKLHVFRYSRRPGTQAASMVDPVDPAVIAARAARVREAGERLRSAWLDAHIGASVEVLVEESTAASCTGTTREYARVRVERDAQAGAADDREPGHSTAACADRALVDVRITGRSGEVLLGRLDQG